MDADPSDEPEPAAGWLLVGGRDQLDVTTVLERHGCIYRWPLPPDASAERFEPGQPCFLFATDRARTVGLWAVGSVVAPVLERAAGEPLLPGEAALDPAPDPATARRWAEVELLGLDKPLGRDALEAHRVLARSDLFTGGDRWRVEPLRGGELRALESLDFWLAEPDGTRRAALDALLAAEDELLD